MCASHQAGQFHIFQAEPMPKPTETKMNVAINNSSSKSAGIDTILRKKLKPIAPTITSLITETPDP